MEEELQEGDEKGDFDAVNPMKPLGLCHGGIWIWSFKQERPLNEKI